MKEGGVNFEFKVPLEQPDGDVSWVEKWELEMDIWELSAYVRVTEGMRMTTQDENVILGQMLHQIWHVKETEGMAKRDEWMSKEQGLMKAQKSFRKTDSTQHKSTNELMS